MPPIRSFRLTRIAPTLVLVALLVAGLATAASGAPRVTIQPGETLGGIATRHGVSVSALAAANGITDPNRIVAGTALTIPGAAGAATPRRGSGGGGGYTVRSGDTLGAIAARHGVSVRTLAAANGITNPNSIRAGMRLRIDGAPGATRPAPSAVAPSGSGWRGAHTVRSGDTLGAIAARYGTTTARLAAANGISNPNVLTVGRRLRVPGGVAISTGPLTPVTAATSGWGAHPSRATVRALLERSAARHGVDPALARAVAWHESGFWQGARSSTGAIGVMQLMPGTATWLGPALLGRGLNPYDVGDNVEGGVAYLAYLTRQTGSTRLALASYYQGLGGVRARGLLPETERYVASITSSIGRV
jgi:LysM repeat protein